MQFSVLFIQFLAGAFVASCTLPGIENLPSQIGLTGRQGGLSPTPGSFFKWFNPNTYSKFKAWAEQYEYPESSSSLMGKTRSWTLQKERIREQVGVVQFLPFIGWSFSRYTIVSKLVSFRTRQSRREPREVSLGCTCQIRFQFDELPYYVKPEKNLFLFVVNKRHIKRKVLRSLVLKSHTCLLFVDREKIPGESNQSSFFN